MNSLSIINIIHVFFPAIAGLVFTLFPLREDRSKKINFYVYCLIYFVLSVFSFILILGENDYGIGRFPIMESFSLYPQKDIARFILLTPFAYFIQMKRYIDKETPVSIEAFFQGVFFTLLGLSVYVQGGLSVYCILELLALSAIIIDTMENNTWKKENIILQGFGTALVFVPLVIVDVLMKVDGFGNYINFIVGENLRTTIALVLLLGIFFKSTVIEYGIGHIKDLGNTAIHLSIIKLYIPIRFLFESDIFHIMESNILTEWAILATCLVNCLRITEKKSKLNVLQLAGLFSGLILLGFTVLGSTGLYLLVKYSFYLTLLLVLYNNTNRARKDNLFGLIALLLSTVVMTSEIALTGRGLPFFIVTIVILYLMVKYIWSSIVASLGEAQLGTRNIEGYLIRNVIMVVVILILTEVNIEYFTGGSIWLN